jgi:tripartite-type tricarboxylate transporter receptor subunit TctC
MVHVGYQSSPQTLVALIVGDVRLLVVDGGAGIPLVKEGQRRCSATTGRQRTPALPEVATVM